MKRKLKKIEFASIKLPESIIIRWIKINKYKESQTKILLYVDYFTIFRQSRVEYTVEFHFFS